MAEAGVALASVGIEDSEGRSTARWAGPVAGDDHLRSLADHVPAEPDPRSPSQLEPDAGRLADGGRQAASDARRLQHHERDAGPTGERRQPSESICERPGQASRQVDHQQVHRPTRQERPGDRQPLLGIRRRQDDEPLRPDPSRDRLDRVERRCQVQPGDDRAGGLGLGGESQRQRRPAARGVTAHRHAHPPRHATGPEDGIELGKAGRVDPIGISRVIWVPAGLGARLAGVLERHGGERPDHIAHEPGGGCTPARSQGREGCAQVRRGSSHAFSIEHLFE